MRLFCQLREIYSKSWTPIDVFCIGKMFSSKCFSYVIVVAGSFLQTYAALQTQTWDVGVGRQVVGQLCQAVQRFYIPELTIPFWASFSYICCNSLSM